MNRKVLLTVLALALSMLFGAVAPVMASQPKGTYIFGEIDLPNIPSAQFFSAPNILHARDGDSLNYMFGAPWGDSITPGHVSGIMNANLETGTGEGLTQFVDSYPTGTVEGSTPWKLVGAGMWIYEGPSFTVGTWVLVHDVTPLIGLQFEGTFVGHGRGGLEGIQWSGEYKGVALIDLATGNPIGVNVVWGPATYMYTGQNK